MMRTMSHPAKTQSRMSAQSLLLVLALLAVGTGLGQAAESFQDGPYVARGSDGGWISRWIEGDSDAPRVREQTVDVGDVVTVAGVGSLPAFDVKLRAPASPAPSEINIRHRTALFVMADTHGEFEIAVQLLQKHGIVDERLRWSFGRGHLAVLGDVFDRGPNQTELLWLFYKLEAEAARAGGGVHLALGNHESMVLRGDDRYLNPKYPRVASVLGVERHASLWNEQSLLGQWLRTKAAVFRLGSYLCLHGGISREVINRGLTSAAMNQTVRAALAEQAGAPDAQTEFVMGPSGPLWYRGYFAEVASRAGNKPAEMADIELIRGRFGVQAILVGHTTVPTVTALYGGRVIAVQVYPHRDEQTHAPVMEALMIRKDGQRYRARVDGTSELLPRS